MITNAFTPDHIVEVVTQALPVHGTVQAARHIHGGVSVRVTGRSIRVMAMLALAAAGYSATCDEAHGLLHIPPPRKAPR